MRGTGVRGDRGRGDGETEAGGKGRTGQSEVGRVGTAIRTK